MENKTSNETKAANDANTVLADSFLPDDEMKCCLCGKKESADTKSDFLRECFEMNQDGKWDKGLMQPRLNFIEMAYIRQGTNYVCNNRSRCRDRQAKNSRDKRAKNFR